MGLTRDGISPEVLRQQLQLANTRIQVLVAQLDALKAESIKSDPADLNLLERVAWALRDASDASTALQSMVMDPTGFHAVHLHDRGLPGGATKRARYQRGKLERAIENALDAWEQVKENDFFAVSKNQPPRVRCRTRSCPREGRRVPAWEFDGTPNEFCSKCGHRYPPPEEAA